MASRREALQAGVGGALFGAAGGLKSLNDLRAKAGPPSHPPPSSAQNQTCDPCEAISPFMPRKDAWAKIFGDALLKTQMRATLYERYRHSGDIDPDIMILKSLSPMAKITLTRQRRVEREIQLAYADQKPGSEWTPMRDWLEVHVRQLMWGNDR